MNIKKVLASAVLAGALFTSVHADASETYWTNPTEYACLPSGLYHPIGDANKSERLPKGHTYKVSFDASTYGENVLLVYAQNKSYLNEFIELPYGHYNHYEFTFYAKTNTKVVFEDLQKMGDIFVKNIKVERVN